MTIEVNGTSENATDIEAAATAASINEMQLTGTAAAAPHAVDAEEAETAVADTAADHPAARTEATIVAGNPVLGVEPTIVSRVPISSGADGIGKLATLKTQTSISVALISPRSDARAIDPKTVSALVESIKQVGLLSPLHVRQVQGGYELIAGAHRLAAFRELGLPTIPCFVRSLGDLEAELAMIDENLFRAELGPAEFAKALSRRKAIYEQLHPETVHGAALNEQHVANFATRQARYTAEVAGDLGISERTAQLHAERGEKIDPAVLDKLVGTPLNKGVVLDALKNLPTDEQKALVDQKLAEEPQKRQKTVDPAARDKRHVDKLISVWNVASEKAQSDFLKHIGAARNV